jgi:hypothetical protein
VDLAGKIKQAEELMRNLRKQHSLQTVISGALTDDMQQQFGTELATRAGQEKAALEELRKHQRAMQQELQQAFSNSKSRLDNFQASVDAKAAQLQQCESMFLQSHWSMHGPCHLAGLRELISHFRTAAERLQAAQAKLRDLPHSMKLEHMRKDIEQERAKLSQRSLDSDLQASAVELETIKTDMGQMSKQVAELRRTRDRLTSAMQAVTRLRAAEENCADLQEQARYPLVWAACNL